MIKGVQRQPRRRSMDPRAHLVAHVEHGAHGLLQVAAILLLHNGLQQHREAGARAAGGRPRSRATDGAACGSGRAAGRRVSALPALLPQATGMLPPSNTRAACPTHRHVLHQNIFGPEPARVRSKHRELAVAAGAGAGGTGLSAARARSEAASPTASPVAAVPTLPPNLSHTFAHTPSHTKPSVSLNKHPQLHLQPPLFSYSPRVR